MYRAESFQEMNMKMTILKPSLLALSLVLQAASSQAGDCTGEQSAKNSVPAMGNFIYNPWLDIMRMQAAMNREFNALASPFWMPVMYVPPTAFMMPAMKNNSLKRTDEGYQLEFKLPGYKPEDIQVRLDGRLLTVRAQSSNQDTIKVGQQSEQSQTSRSFSETLTLPGAVQASGLKENYKDGVLTVTVPSSKGSGGSL
jgi:HSP20 family protein